MQKGCAHSYLHSLNFLFLLLIHLSTILQQYFNNLAMPMSRTRPLFDIFFSDIVISMTCNGKVPLFCLAGDISTAESGRRADLF